MSDPVYSFAQNREDVLLWRALRGVDPAEGFWIDIGANDPTRDSVTKLFSLRGWRGINVEPVAECIERLEQQRPRDINVRAAVGAQPGTLVLQRPTGNSALSTFDPRLAQMYRDEGQAMVEETVPVITLAQLVEQHGTTTCHFLKVDVEGHEHDVFAGADFAAFRPWIIMAEATYPQLWQPVLEQAGYQVALHDGLNLVFTAAERPDLRAVLSVPVNSLDLDVVYRRLTDTHEHTAFITSTAIAAVAAMLLAGRDQPPSPALRLAAEELAGVLADRPDLTRAFCRGAQLDVRALISWAVSTPPSADSHLPLLVAHLPALRDLLDPV